MSADLRKVTFPLSVFATSIQLVRTGRAWSARTQKEFLTTWCLTSTRSLLDTTLTWVCSVQTGRLLMAPVYATISTLLTWQRDIRLRWLPSSKKAMILWAINRLTWALAAEYPCLSWLRHLSAPAASPLTKWWQIEEQATSPRFALFRPEPWRS